MSKISTNAEFQRKDINKGSIAAKIAYLQNIKINLESLSKPTEASDSAALHTLADLLNAGPSYRSNFAGASTFDEEYAPLRRRSSGAAADNEASWGLDRAEPMQPLRCGPRML